MRVVWFILVEITLLYLVNISLNLFLLKGYNMMIDYYFMMSRFLIVAILYTKPLLYLLTFLLYRDLPMTRIQKISTYSAHGKIDLYYYLAVFFENI